MVGRYPNPVNPANRPAYPPTSNQHPAQPHPSQPHPSQPNPAHPNPPQQYPPQQNPAQPSPSKWPANAAHPSQPPPQQPQQPYPPHPQFHQNPNHRPVNSPYPSAAHPTQRSHPPYPPINATHPAAPRPSPPSSLQSDPHQAPPPNQPSSVHNAHGTTLTAPQAYQPNRPLPPQRPAPPQHPLPSDVAAAANGLASMSMAAAPAYNMQPCAQSAPPGMTALPMSDAAAHMRPDLSGPAVAMRIASGDPPSNPPKFDNPPGFSASPTSSVDPAACPTEIFVPTSLRCVRLTNAAFPMTKALGAKYSLPLGAVIQPLAPPGLHDDPVPVINFGTTGIVRCRRCRSYVNFACSFRDGGHRWICNMCSLSNDTPSDYFAPLDQNGKRTDAADRPELHRGSVEFVAPAEYMVRPPMPPVYFFLLETTPASINSGVLAAGIAGIRNSINAMPDEGRTRVAIITFDSAIQFYCLRAGEDAEPSVYIVSDIEDVFLPTPNEILAQLSESRPCFEKALNLIESTYSPPSGVISVASCLGAALEGAQKAMEMIGGKLIVIAASRPTAGPGALRERGDNGILGTDRERAILRPDASFYSQLAVSMSKFQIGCDLFLCSSLGHYLDLSSLAQLAKFTGGELFYCSNFEAAKDAPRLQLAVNRVLARETGLEAVMRIRAAKSVKCSKFSGRFFVRATSLLAMPNVDADKAYSVQFDIADVSLGDGPFCLQVALLYTTTSGERRIRVHTVALPLANSLADLFMRVDSPATGNILTRMAADAMKDRGQDELRKSMTEKVIIAFCKYREVCLSQYFSNGISSQFITTDAMKLLPLLMHGLVRSPILCRDFCGAFLYKFDDKAALIHDVDVMNVAETSAFLYPNIIPVYPWPGQGERAVKHPDGVIASFASLRPDWGIVIDDGRSITLWLGEAIMHKFVSELLGSAAGGQVDARFLGVELMRRGGSSQGMIAQVFAAVKGIVGSRRPSVAVQVVLQGDRTMQPRIEAMMMEERTAATKNYPDFLLELQRRAVECTGRK